MKPALSPGMRIGAYVVEEHIGSGGMADVFVASHEVTGRRTALKVLRDRTEDDDRERFLREIRALGALDHPNVVTILDAGAHEGAPYYVMTLLPGRSLSRMLAGGARLPVSDAAAVAVLVCRGVGAAHDIGVIHRDIKPSNVFACGEPVPPHESVKVIDFGVCRPTDQLGLTRTGTVVGTPTYMSPEQVLGQRDIDARTDVYSIGVLAYRMLTGTLPFDADSKGEAFIAIGSGQLLPLRTRSPELPTELEQVLDRALALRPANRWQDVASLGSALRPFARGSKLLRLPSGWLAKPFLPSDDA